MTVTCANQVGLSQSIQLLHGLDRSDPWARKQLQVPFLLPEWCHIRAHSLLLNLLPSHPWSWGNFFTVSLRAPVALAPYLSLSYLSYMLSYVTSDAITLPLWSTYFLCPPWYVPAALTCLAEATWFPGSHKAARTRRTWKEKLGPEFPPNVCWQHLSGSGWNLCFPC